jgi:hypothetical protein
MRQWPLEIRQPLLKFAYSGGAVPELHRSSLFAGKPRRDFRPPVTLSSNLRCFGYVSIQAEGTQGNIFVKPEEKSIPGGVDNPKQQDIVVRSWFAPPLERRKREHGAIPWLPRSGKRERPPSESTGPQRAGKRRPVGHAASSLKACRPQARRPASNIVIYEQSTVASEGKVWSASSPSVRSPTRMGRIGRIACPP